MERTYFAIDLKSFYASVECVSRGLDPLTAPLVVADESRTDKTICLAVSPALKAFGIPGRARLFEVKQKLRDIKARDGRKIDLFIAPPNMARYMEVSADVYKVYLRYAAKEEIHVYSIDEVFMDATESLPMYGVPPRELAGRIIRDVYQATGITATAGIGTNLYLAKVAMDILAKHAPADRDGVRMAQLNERTYREQLWSWRPLTAFWRIGRGIAAKLESNGMYTMGDVARRSLSDEEGLYRLFGVDAELLIDHAWGKEPCGMEHIKAFRPRKHSTGSGQVLPCPYDVVQTRLIVQEMTEELVLELAEKHLVTDAVSLVVNYDRENLREGRYEGRTAKDFYGREVPEKSHATAHLPSLTRSTSQIMEAVLRAYDAMADPGLTVRAVYLTADRVESDEAAFVQLDMFTDRKKTEKEERLQQTMLKLRDRFGSNVLLKGTDLKEGARARERNGQIGGHKRESI